MKHFPVSNSDRSRSLSRAANQDLPPPTKDLLALAKLMLAIRGARGSFFSATLLGEPGYDIILAMFIAEEQGQVLCASELALAAGAPSTVAMRWIRSLEQLGLVAQIWQADPAGCNLILTPRGRVQVWGHLESAWCACQA